MIDMLFAFPSEAEAQAALEPFGLYQTFEDYSGWDGSRVIDPITVTMLDGTTPSGWWLAASFSVRQPKLEILAQAVIDREASGEKLSDYVLGTTWPMANVDLVAVISPVWAGSNYPLPGLPVPANELDERTV